jgi:agarase
MKHTLLTLTACLLTSPVLLKAATPKNNSTPYPATIQIDLTKARAIRVGAFEKSDLDRNIYFRSYYPPGSFSVDRNRELGEIGAVPGRGILAFRPSVDENNLGGLEQDAAHPGQPTPESLKTTLNSYVTAFQNAAWQYPGARHAMAFSGYPEWMRAPKPGAPKKELLEDYEKFLQEVPLPEFYPLCAEIISAWFDTLKASNCSPPSWWTIQNEPGGEWDDQLANLTRVVADGLRKNHPEVKVSGPCSAWPYPGADWKSWENTQKPFIEQAGDCVGAYDLHFYSKGHWSLPPDPAWQAKRVPEPSLYEAQRLGIGTVWEYGRLDAYLDLFAAYHMQFFQVSQPKPMIISEFGHQTVHPQFGPWKNDFKPWLYMTTVIRQWLTYMERPEVELTVPFILGESAKGHAPQRGMAIYTRPDAPDDFSVKVTRFREFYEFFKELKGRRVPTQVADGQQGDALRVRSFLDGKVAYLLIHNSRGFPRHPAVASIEANLGRDAKGQPIRIVNTEVRRLYYEGNIPDPQRDETASGGLHIEQIADYQLLADLSKLELRGEETAIVRLTLSAEPQTESRVTEIFSYAPATLLEIKPGEPLEIKLPLTKWPGRIVGARVSLGLARDGGFAENPEVKVNGVALSDFDVTWSKDVKNFHGLAVGKVPLTSLREGENTLTLSFPRMESGGFPRLVTAKLVTEHENPTP